MLNHEVKEKQNWLTGRVKKLEKNMSSIKIANGDYPDQTIRKVLKSKNLLINSMVAEKKIRAKQTDLSN